MVKYFIEGGGFMYPILIILLLGIAIIIAKFVSLTLASINTKKFMKQVTDSLHTGGVDAATEICASTKGPVASIIHAGLLRYNRGIENVEKAMMNAATIEMAFLERGLTWIGTATSLAPMFGFMGTVWGMISAFDEIAKANDISPAIVAGGIKVALLTTVFGLMAAVVTQFFHNYFQAKIDKLIIDMEEASVDMVDTLIEMENK
ncbi:MAG: MotA/TolQ/ExbB proton channel family protein [Candidatus Delongbacteria bacterium]|nr:MotA/TolQ/ExbB proton channel family protein [bacterium]MBL7034038.1 MotA/TolQ/ExbB proton channel family protein [Candidatus Delongbacteria bacterium]